MAFLNKSKISPNGFYLQLDKRFFSDFQIQFVVLYENRQGEITPIPMSARIHSKSYHRTED
jgi:hypothetical protein